MPRQKTNWFWEGFKQGVLGGILVTTIAEGLIFVTAMLQARFVIMVARLFGWIITAISAYTRAAALNTRWDGRIVGFLLSNEITTWLVQWYLKP